MSQIETTSLTKAYRERCEDRVDIIHAKQRTVIVVADGAGGTGSGNLAAEAVVRETRSRHADVHSADGWAETLRRVDQRIGVGEATAVVVDIRPYGIAGASVGHSQAWVIRDGEIIDLTSDQNRKPLIGSEACAPVAFAHSPLDGLLIVATDGLFNYAKRDEISRIVFQSDFYEVARKCVELVQLPSGDLWDDVGIVVGRAKPQRTTRIKYTI